MRSIEDATIGKNVRRHRGYRPQRTVALSMQSLGDEKWRKTWTQQTVDRTERGLRALKLSEAVTLAHILGVEVDQLIEDN